MRISFRSYKNTRIKIERGSVVTDWTPPVDDPLVSGGVETRNLLLNTMQPITSTASSDNVYAYTDYQYSEETIPIGVYTFSANIDVLNGSFDTVSIVPFSAELSNAQMGGEKVDCKIYEHRVIAILEITKEVATRITVYTGIMGSTQGNSMRISNAKLEKGVNLNPRWSPAPEDIAIRVKDDHILIIGAN